MRDMIQWGILGPGDIARVFADDLVHAPHARITAVGSRSQERADDFAAKYQIPYAYGSYKELIENPDVDIIYVATPHPMHKEHVQACLQAGKAVLCEKSFTMNAAELEELVVLARKNKVFLMEAMWTRYLPAIEKVREWLASGVIGDVHMIDVRFGNHAVWNPESRLFNPSLGGGALLDVGIYGVSFISMVMGQQPTTIKSLVKLGATGVDEVFTALFGYEGGQMAHLMAGLSLKSKHEVTILGSKGEITVPDFWQAKTVVLSVYGKQEETYVDKAAPRGYTYEANEAMRCLREGRLESAIMPLDESLAIMQTMDRLRADWGLKYPFEASVASHEKPSQ
ncbi:Gfo/Idh/MocA family protein [Paenibacillus agricola]|uniref:Gfo/Idh/MocA family oxidoreductase n=1 Tax=Paenibacillus agricola TaxID=2716264 RepID=A0ABX0J8I5_9BACL|nr:Gfo/Idh/MocA family oxidoreductase [Paenibacillus agricola]NHN30444.1 Gfo/Idh/MocA family oxidoreductase [Paenibacillus agricola]